MTDNIKKQRTYQYHEVVIVDVTVDEDARIVEIGYPYLDGEDCLPHDGRTVFSPDDWEDDPSSDGWLEDSPADFDEDGDRTAAAHIAAFNMVRDALSKFAERRVPPTCTSCHDPLEEGTVHVGGADPFCPSCWHEDCSVYGIDCAQCGAWLCADCERISDGEKHTDSGGQTICSDCVVQ